MEVQVKKILKKCCYLNKQLVCEYFVYEVMWGESRVGIAVQVSCLLWLKGNRNCIN